jgi:hypothetical protein
MSISAPAASAPNRAGLRQGIVSEFTLIAPLKPDGAAKLRAVLSAQGGRFDLADKMGTVHDMRFAIIENDTKLLFATTYDGDWDSYINDFAAKIPEALDRLFSQVEGYPGITSPNIKEFILAHQVTAIAWYCAYPETSVAQIRKGQRVLGAFENLLDAANG